MRVAYVDARFGAAGDMLLGAALDAGADIEAVREALGALPVEGWSLDAHAVRRAGFAATKADVTVETPQPPRTASEIVTMIDAAALPPRVRERAVATFELLGSAERAVHGTPEGEDAHLHEVGGVDAIVDVVGTFAALETLGVERICASGLPAGGGTARAAHGCLPVPAPAVLEMAARSGATLLEAQPGEPPSELVTPTAMAILGAVAEFERPALRLERIGIGAGTRDPEGWPNVVRLWIGEAEERATGLRPIALLETNVDDMPGEHLPFLEARLREAGALDVWWTAVQMKKGRPGLQITAVAAREDADAVAASLLEHSPTLGVRATELLRYEAEREVFEFESSLGPAAVKVKRLPGEPPRAAPEYEHARALAERGGLPIAEVYALLTREALALLE